MSMPDETVTIPRADYEALVDALKLCRVLVQHDRDLVDDLCDITAQNADDVTDRLDGFLADIDGALAKAAAP